jgi:hypothetical protein
MLGYNPRVFKPHSEVCPNDLLPQDNIYRQVEKCLDLDFVRDLVCSLYSDKGRLVSTCLFDSFFKWLESYANSLRIVIITRHLEP